ncbi:MAG TPA: ABC transporter permease subunit [Clostridia bacterium]|nr:ABC transporter permease subunit [Clostridia bacterium]
MGAIFRREFKSYFSSAIGYVFLSVFLFFSGYFFINVNIGGNTNDMSSFFSSIIFIYVFLIPILTMKLMCEDKKQKTDQILLTSPVSLSGIVIGKFLAALCVFAMALSSVAVFGIILAVMSSVDGWVIVGNIVAMLFVGSALIAIGIFISALTESQMIAAVASFFIMLMLFMADNFSSSTNAVLSAITGAISITTHYNNFALGIFNLADVVFYCSMAAIFLFLTMRVLEKRRWS